MARRRLLAVGTAGAAAVAGGAIALRAKRRVAFPPGDDAIGADDALSVAAEVMARHRVRRRDLAMSFQPAIATSVEPLLHGRRYFPRMLDDIRAATDHIHLLIYGYKQGEIGTTFLDALGEKVNQGVEVRLA